MEEAERIQREDEEIEELARVNQRNLRNIVVIFEFRYNAILIFALLFCLGFEIILHLIKNQLF